jgi:hypothetical protein
MVDGISAANPWTSGMMGIQTGMSLLDSSANTIARQSITATDPMSGSSSALPGGDLIKAIGQQTEGLYQVKASVKGIEIANKTLESLFRAVA